MASARIAWPFEQVDHFKIDTGRILSGIFSKGINETYASAIFVRDV